MLVYCMGSTSAHKIWDRYAMAVTHDRHCWNASIEKDIHACMSKCPYTQIVSEQENDKLHNIVNSMYSCILLLLKMNQIDSKHRISIKLCTLMCTTYSGYL